MPKKQATKIPWERHVEDWRRSQKTQSQYCREKRINLNTFRYHLRKSEEVGTNFVRLPEIPMKTEPQAGMQITIRTQGYAGTIRLQLTPEVTP